MFGLQISFHMPCRMQNMINNDSHMLPLDWNKSNKKKNQSQRLSSTFSAKFRCCPYKSFLDAFDSTLAGFHILLTIFIEFMKCWNHSLLPGVQICTKTATRVRIGSTTWVHKTDLVSSGMDKPS